jgi:hypothetical protein
MAKFVSNPKKYFVIIRNKKTGKKIEQYCSSLSEVKGLTSGLSNEVLASFACMDSSFKGIHIDGKQIRTYSGATNSAPLVKAYKKRSVPLLKESDMLSPKVLQMWLTAREHGFKARPNLTGGLELDMPWLNIETREKGIEKIQCHDLRSLKLALGY